MQEERSGGNDEEDENEDEHEDMGIMNDIVRRDVYGEDRKEDSLYGENPGMCETVYEGSYMTMPYTIKSYMGMFPEVYVSLDVSELKRLFVSLVDSEGKSRRARVVEPENDEISGSLRVSYTGEGDFVGTCHETRRDGRRHSLRKLRNDAEAFIEQIMDGTATTGRNP